MKRTATSELNRDNWDQDDEPEEAGRFKTVGQEELSKRVIKVAKRRLPRSSDDQRPLLSGFSGFGSTSTTSAPDVKSAFSFLSNLNGSANTPASNEVTNVAKDNSDDKEKPSEESVYLANLKSLNKCVLDWIDKCIKKNPACVLTPIFQDYEKHINSLKKPIPVKNEESKSNENASGFKFNFAQSNSPNVNNPLSQSNTSSSTSTLSNSIFPTLVKPPIATTTSSWLPSSSISKTNFFSSLASNSADKPTLGGLSNAPENTESTGNDNGEDDTPPINDFKPVKEDDALFSQRVKLFVQKDKQYSERGVGTLFIKEAKDNKGNVIHQALIRADTSLGNIIFNIRITSDIPIKRVGKNNVMLVCLPTPDSKPPPIPVLLRVKTEEDADKLLEEINKYK